MIAAVIRNIFFLTAAVFLAGTNLAFARDAAFADPGMISGGSKTVTDAVAVEPKAEIDTGESIINVPRRTTLFFTNKTNSPVEVVGVATNDDLNVKSSIVSNDCSKEGKIAPASRCTVIVETMPIGPSSWSSEVLLTHNGPGRIARAKLTGKPSVQSSGEKRDSGFTLSTKEIKPIDFGQVDAGEAKVVRTALMINDSGESITIISIDVIAAENGFERLDQGCVVDMELRPGESCPVTLLWKPLNKGLLSTDLIIRHTGKLGFAVIPIRGMAKEQENAEKNTAGTESKGANKSEGRSSRDDRIPATAEMLEKSLIGIPPLTSDALPANVTAPSSPSIVTAVTSGEFRLIGTIGDRAILLKPDGTTSVVAVGEEVESGGGKKAKLTNLSSRSAELFIDGKKKELIIGAAKELTSKAVKSTDSKSEIQSGMPSNAAGSR